MRCPSCHGFVELNPAQPRCSCGFEFEWRDRVLIWEKLDDRFYETRYAAMSIRFDRTRMNRFGGRVLLHFLVYGYYESILRFVPPGARVLDIGCGAGAKLLAQWARMTGLDISLDGLERSTSSYDRYLRADVRNVDFSSGSFDAIVSSFFWEHVTPADKDQLLEKFRRWLRPRGKIILMCDVASNNPLFKWARKEPQFFREGFIEHDGHYGLETAPAAMERFLKHGFSLQWWHAMNRSPLQHLPVFGWLTPYGRKHAWAGTLASLGSWMGAHKIPNRLYTAGIQLFDDSLGRLLPLDWARILLAVLENSN